MMKKLLTLFLALAASVGTLFAQSGTCGNNLTWTLNNGTLTISGTGAMTDYTSSYPPNTPSWSSYNESIKTVIIEDGVTSIGNSAFSWCISLTSITIPNSVISFGRYVFYDCRSLTSILVDSENPNYCDIDGVLFNKNKTTLIQYPAGKSATSYTIPNSVTSIGNDAFDGCSSLTSITIPTSVTYIGSYAFGYCYSLTSISIPNSVTSIGYNAFFGCGNLTSVTVDSENPNYCDIDGVLFNKNKTTLIRYPEGKSATSYTIPNSVTSIGNDAFDGCSSLTSITIPTSVTSIKWGAFSECRSLTSVTIPNGVTSIEGYAFSECSSLTSVTIPNSVTTIGKQAFKGCRSLTSVTIPNSVTSIGDMAFEDCTGLTSITCEAVAPPTLGNNVFGGVDKSIPLYVPAQSIDLYKAAEQWKDFTNILPITSSTPATFTITFLNYDGSELQSSEVEAGTMPQYNGTEPTKPSDVQYTYTFAGWDKEIAVVTADATYTATFEAIAVGGGATGGIGLFSVSATQKVTFSQGNLQYRASDNTWRFANEQYDVISWEQNKQLSQTCNQWIDLFKFASSGYNGFYPWADNTYNSSEDITNTNYDWGVYNPIVNGGNKAGMWRTLTISEWTYLFNERKNANSLFGVACVNGINGLIILPDEFDVSTCSINTSHSGYTNNILTIEQWKAFETNGAIFLPANGHIPLGNQGNLDGFYWSSTADNWCNDGYADVGAYAWYFYYNDIRSTDPDWMQDRRSVRLVRDTIVPALNTIEKHLSGYFSIGNGKTVKFSSGNLQYRASDNTWRFANEQYDVIGNDNTNISDTYSGWIDLFGWGTGNNPTLSSTDENQYPTFVDWGINPIVNGGNQPNLWRTLSASEMGYIFGGRPNADKLYSMCVVNGRHGLIVFPDNCDIPQNIDFVPAYKDFTNDVNNYTLEEWQQLEAVGAVFFPVAGVRKGLSVSETEESGYYWHTDALSSSTGAREMWLGRMYIYYNPGIGGTCDRANGISVRLVRDQNEQEPVYSLSVSVDGEGMVTGAGEYKSGTTATLTATPASGYTFSQWSDGKTDNPRTITLASDTTFTAIFEEDIILPEAQIWPVIMDHITSDKYQQNIVGDFRDNGIDNHQYIWVNGETYTIRTAFGLNYYGNNGGYTSLTVKAPDGWSGGGFHVANAQSLKMMKVLKDSIVAHPDDYYLHIAIKSNDHASHDFRLFDNEQLTFTIGTTPIYQGTVIGDFPRDGEWHGLYIPLASFADNIAVTNLDETELGLHVFSFLSGDAVGAELNLDAVYFCNTAFKDKECVSYRYNVYSTDGGIVSANYSECPQNKLSLNAKPDYGYHFTQWSDGNTDNPRTITMTQDTTLTAVFAKNTFLISFVNYDGSELQSSEVEAGTMLQYNGATPTKPADEDNTYTFSGWTPAVVAVAGNASYTATFQSVPFVKYTITWQDEDGNVIKTDQVAQGATPAFTGTTPTKEGYTFAGWLPNIKPATKDICYTTFFERNKIETPVYTVNINGENCSLNINNQYPEGTVITLEAVADECFEFQQWSDGNKENPRSVTVTKDMSLTAEFNKVRYTVTGQPSTGGQVQIHKQ